MKATMPTRLLPGLLALAVAVAVAVAQPPDKAAHLAIVVNKQSSLSDISSAELARYFKAERSKTPNGVKLVVVMQEPGRPERAAALRDILKMTEAEYGKHILHATFTGAVAGTPKALASSRAVIEFVGVTAGGLGYVRGDEADDSVKVLKVDGKFPGEAGYAFSVK